MRGARGALCTKAKVLGAESERLGSKVGLRAASIRVAFCLISLSFFIRDLKVLINLTALSYTSVL